MKKLVSLLIGLLVFYVSVVQAGVYVLPSDYENAYYSSVTGKANGTIVFGQTMNINGLTLSPYLLNVSGVDLMCYNVPKIPCKNGRTSYIDVSITSAGIFYQNRWLKLNAVSGFTQDIGNDWRICATGVGSNTFDRVYLSQCVTNTAGFCIVLNYTPDALSIKKIIDYYEILAGRAFIIISYKQTCR